MTLLHKPLPRDYPQSGSTRTAIAGSTCALSVALAIPAVRHSGIQALLNSPTPGSSPLVHGCHCSGWRVVLVPDRSILLFAARGAGGQTLASQAYGAGDNARPRAQCGRHMGHAAGGAGFVVIAFCVRPSSLLGLEPNVAHLAGAYWFRACSAHACSRHLGHDRVLKRNRPHRITLAIIPRGRAQRRPESDIHIRIRLGIAGSAWATSTAMFGVWCSRSLCSPTAHRP